MSIAEVDFGRLDAEAETHLADYFVDTGVLAKLRTGKKQYVIGRKGAGKTALFRLATSEKIGREIIPLEFADYPWEAHKRIQEEGMPLESAYVASWKFTFLAAACRYWSASAAGDAQGKSKGILRQIYENSVPGLLEILGQAPQEDRASECRTSGEARRG